ncbi:MAG: YiiX/YebB-like N1pC/P60 family cysteine hydrolase [Holophaga sp.]|nr:YiiX/YebB-like N1pC/P60 family cysteine hydrolase [Holophaga sp.]
MSALRHVVPSLLLLALVACSRPIVVHPPKDRLEREARMLEAVTRLGQPGDWLVIRGYHATDNLVSTLTHAPFSHAAVLDPEQRQVIEAEGSGLHTTSTADFVKKAQRLMLVRAQWATTPERQQAAVVKARSLVGRPYDFAGLVGANAKDRYYCSELAVAVFGAHVSRSRDHIPLVIPPDQLHYWGTVVWDSGAILVR